MKHICRFRSSYLASVFAILMLFLNCPVLLAQGFDFITYRNEMVGFSIQYPPYMSRVQRNEGGTVLLALQNTNAPHPTFTVTRHLGPYTEPSMERHESRIQQEFRRMGYIDATVRGRNTGRFRYLAKQRRGVILSYTRMGVKMMAEIVYVSAPRSHFILAYTDTAPSFSSGGAVRNGIFGSFNMSPALLSGGTTPRIPFSNQPQYNSQANSYSNTQWNHQSSSTPYSGKDSGLVIVLVLVAIVIAGASSIAGGDGNKKAGNE